MVERKVTIGFNDEFREHTSWSTNMWNAIGYLISWAYPTHENARYLNVSIWGCRYGELNAVYTDKEGNPTYEIGAIEREDGTYSFHS